METLNNVAHTIRGTELRSCRHLSGSCYDTVFDVCTRIVYAHIEQVGGLVSPCVVNLLAALSRGYHTAVLDFGKVKGWGWPLLPSPNSRVGCWSSYTRQCFALRRIPFYDVFFPCMRRIENALLSPTGLRFSLIGVKTAETHTRGMLLATNIFLRYSFPCLRHSIGYFPEKKLEIYILRIYI